MPTKATKTTTKKAAPKAVEAVTVSDKKAVIKSHQAHAKDTGSPQVQVAILTQKIELLSAHLKEHKKDNHSRQGLLGMVSKRRKMLKYLQMHDAKKYTQVTQTLGLRK
ncbi:30S ribosomal protein S15 [Candidatus Gracilibacteria bacterium]|nr:30S ribosomal protein S15 [Candidatus Gracilibacteria bacterium]